MWRSKRQRVVYCWRAYRRIKQGAALGTRQMYFLEFLHAKELMEQHSSRSQSESSGRVYALTDSETLRRVHKL